MRKSREGLPLLLVKPSPLCSCWARLSSWGGPGAGSPLSMSAPGVASRWDGQERLQRSVHRGFQYTSCQLWIGPCTAREGLCEPLNTF